MWLQWKLSLSGAAHSDDQIFSCLIDQVSYKVVRELIQLVES